MNRGWVPQIPFLFWIGIYCSPYFIGTRDRKTSRRTGFFITLVPSVPWWNYAVCYSRKERHQYIYFPTRDNCIVPFEGKFSLVFLLASRFFTVLFHFSLVFPFKWKAFINLNFRFALHALPRSRAKRGQLLMKFASWKLNETLFFGNFIVAKSESKVYHLFSEDCLKKHLRKILSFFCFMLLFCWVQQRNVQKFITHVLFWLIITRAKLLFC